MFEFDFRNIIVLISLAIHAVLLWILYRYGKQTHGGRAYTLAILAIAGWVAPMVLYRGHYFGEVVLWARLLYVMASLTSTTFLVFAYIYAKEKRLPYWMQWILLVEGAFIAYLCFHPTWMIQGVITVTEGEDIITWGPLYPLYVQHISLPFLIGFYWLFKKMRAEKGQVRKQVKMILLGYFFAANLAMVTNLLLPWFGYFELNWLGQFFSTLVAVFTTYAILRYKLLNIKIIAAEGFLLLLNLFLFVRFITSDSTKDFSINIFIFIVVFGVSYLLIRSIKKEVEQREEVVQLAKSLEKANLRLQELDRQKTEFLSIASHQLRTPLSIIKGYAELMKDGAYGKPTKKMVAVLSDMDESNERLVRLVDEFLNITRLEQGRTQYTFEPHDMNLMVTSVVDELRNRAEEKGLTLVWDTPKKETPVVMDEEKVRHVVFNYIDNAIKYSPEGTITVTVDNKDGSTMVRVKDHGFGFDKEDEANFFQKFYRGRNVERTDVSGTGLGIYVCKKFIEMHEGRVWAKSPGLGKGSEFGFSIPTKGPKNTKVVQG